MSDHETLRPESYALLKRLGWKPGDRFSMHSVSELMIAFALQVKKNDRETKQP